MRLRTPILIVLALGAAPTPGRADPGAVPGLDRVIVVVMENKDYSQVRDAPFTASLIAGASELTQSFAVTHPSQPNYLALWAASTLGVGDNSCPATGSPFGHANLGHSCEASAKSWCAYSENLPSAGSPVCAWDGTLYTRKHEPWTSFDNLDHLHERPFDDLAVDIANGTLPNLAFVVPNNCHNTHDCSVATGDSWLSDNVPSMLAALGPKGVLILTWDEDASTAGNDNHILTVFAGPLVKPGFASSAVVNHYSVVRTICDGLGFDAFGAAAAASPVTDVWLDYVVDAPSQGTGELALSRPTPNPAQRGWSATLRLPGSAAFEAAILDPAGRRVRILEEGTAAGTVTLHWDGRRDDGSRAGAGVYFLAVRTAGRTLSRKAVLTD